MDINPIFIMGHGRTGTTLLMNLMSLHPDLAWFSGWTNRFPRLPQLSLVSRVNDSVFLENITRGLRRWPRPAEAYGIWDYYFPGFSRAEYDWDEKQLNEEDAESFRRFLHAHVRWQGKKGFITKYTGWPRILFLRAVFPGAWFIFIDRDPRAVVYSFMKQHWWLRGEPEKYESMTPREKIDFYAGKYMDYYRAKLKFTEGKDYIQFFYEDLVKDPRGSLKPVFERISFPFTEDYQGMIVNWKFSYNTNQAWREVLSPEDQEYLDQKLDSPLSDLDYRNR